MLERFLLVASAAAIAILVPAGAGAQTPLDTLVSLAGPAIAPNLAPNLTMPIIKDSGSFAGGAIIYGENTAAGYGLEGVTDGISAGVYGYDTSATGGYGMIGYAKGFGRGLAGISAKGDGILGTADTNGRGVYGTSAHGIGVQGETYDGSGYGGYFLNTASTGTALRASSAGNAIVATSGSGTGVVATSASGDGVVGNSGNGNSVYGVVGTEASYYEQGGNAGVQGVDNSNTTCGSSCLNYGVYGLSNNNGFGVYGSGPGAGIGVYGETGTGTAVEAYGGTGTALHLYGSGTYLIVATGYGNGSDVMTLDDSGNLDLAGTVTTNGTPAVTSRGRGPQIESVGDGQIEAGKGYVALDPAFAKHLDPAYSYRVFLTPNGDSDGLYVSRKTISGFDVRENHHATSTVAFDYRIVGTAKRVTPRRGARIRMPAAPPRNAKLLRDR